MSKFIVYLQKKHVSWLILWFLTLAEDEHPGPILNVPGSFSLKSCFRIFHLPEHTSGNICLHEENIFISAFFALYLVLDNIFHFTKNIIIELTCFPKNSYYFYNAYSKITNFTFSLQFSCQFVCPGGANATFSHALFGWNQQKI